MAENIHPSPIPNLTQEQKKVLGEVYRLIISWSRKIPESELQNLSNGPTSQLMVPPNQHQQDDSNGTHSDAYTTPTETQDNPAARFSDEILGEEQA